MFKKGQKVYLKKGFGFSGTPDFSMGVIKKVNKTPKGAWKSYNVKFPKEHLLVYQKELTTKPFGMSEKKVKTTRKVDWVRKLLPF